MIKVQTFVKIYKKTRFQSNGFAGTTIIFFRSTYGFAMPFHKACLWLLCRCHAR